MQPLHAHSWAEAHWYLRVTPCQDCSQGPWEVRAEADQGQGGTITARCLKCGAEKEFTFQCPPPPEAQDPGAAGLDQIEGMPVEVVNLSSRPSEIVDVGQWLSLFYHLLERASKASNSAETRRVTFQAAQCLDEALKFYGEHEELPPESAFFTAASREAFARRPERFSRESLRGMRSRLPDLRVMAHRLAHDARRPGQKRWWQFWKR